MKKTIVIGLIISMTMMVTTVFAQKHYQGDKRMKKMTPEMKEYLNENILPVMKVQRIELDKELSSDEKSKLDEIRGEMKAMRQQQGEKMKKVRMSEEKPTVEQRKEMREMLNKRHDMMNEVAIMAEAHDASISRLLDEVQPQMEQWRQDVMAMKQNSKPDGNKKGYKNKDKQGKHPNNGQHPGHGKMFGKHMRPNAFLLWDPDQPLPFFDEQGNFEDNLELNVYPNPASDKIQVSIQLAEEANVGLLIFNKDGNEVMALAPESAERGLYSQTIDVSSLTEGLYIIKVNAGEKSAIGRLIVRH